jgi:hypothetical protein
MVIFAISLYTSLGPRIFANTHYYGALIALRTTILRLSQPKADAAKRLAGCQFAVNRIFASFKGNLPLCGQRLPVPLDSVKSAQHYQQGHAVS